MVRGKTELKRIENTTSRQVTFSKRRRGLLKKAFELSVLCDVEVGLVIFSPRGVLYEFASPSSMQKTIDRYKDYAKESIITTKTAHDQQSVHQRTPENNFAEEEQMKEETASLLKKIELLKASKRKILGQNLDECTHEEVSRLEGKLEKGLNSIRIRKQQLMEEQTRQLQEKGQMLLEENQILQDKYNKQVQLPQLPLAASCEAATRRDTSQHMEVETELYIGLPGRENR